MTKRTAAHCHPPSVMVVIATHAVTPMATNTTSRRLRDALKSAIAPRIGAVIAIRIIAKVVIAL